MAQRAGLPKNVRSFARVDSLQQEPPDKKKHGAPGTATWMRVDSTGAASVLELDKNDVMNRAGIHARDLRILDPQLSYPSTILGRERAIVLNLEHLKAIITAEEVLLRNPHNKHVKHFAEELQKRVLENTGEQQQQQGQAAQEQEPQQQQQQQAAADEPSHLRPGRSWLPGRGRAQQSRAGTAAHAQGPAGPALVPNERHHHANNASAEAENPRALPHDVSSPLLSPNGQTAAAAGMNDGDSASVVSGSTSIKEGLAAIFSPSLKRASSGEGGRKHGRQRAARREMRSLISGGMQSGSGSVRHRAGEFSYEYDDYDDGSDDAEEESDVEEEDEEEAEGVEVRYGMDNGNGVMGDEERDHATILVHDTGGDHQDAGPVAGMLTSAGGLQRDVGGEEPVNGNDVLDAEDDAAAPPPFEFQALEVALECVCKDLEKLTVELRAETHEALDRLTLQVSSFNLDRVRTMKNRMSQLISRVQKVREELEQLLDDDDDMAEMFLTRATMAAAYGSPVPGASVHGGTAVAAAAAGAGASVQDGASLPGSPAAASKVTSLYFHRGMGSRFSAYSSVHNDSNDVEELEQLLESYFVQIDGTLNKLNNLREYIDDTEDFINIQIDNRRNRLIQLELVLNAGIMITSIMATIYGVFGVNIPFALNDAPQAFLPVVLGTLGLCGIMFAVLMVYARLRGILL